MACCHSSNKRIVLEHTGARLPGIFDGNVNDIEEAAAHLGSDEVLQVAQSFIRRGPFCVQDERLTAPRAKALLSMGSIKTGICMAS